MKPYDDIDIKCLFMRLSCVKTKPVYMISAQSHIRFLDRLISIIDAIPQNFKTVAGQANGQLVHISKFSHDMTHNVLSTSSFKPFFFISWFMYSSEMNFGHFHTHKKFCFCLFFPPPMCIPAKIKKKKKNIGNY